MALLLEARNLRKVYTKSNGFFSPRSENVALDDFSMAIDDETPAFIAIAGESGSGKTTLAQMLLGFTKPTSGEILYRGQNIHKLNSQAILASIGLEAIGLGPQNEPTLGMTIYWSLQFNSLFRGLWWWWGFPIFFIVFLFLSLFLISAGLDQVANPRLRRNS